MNKLNKFSKVILTIVMVLCVALPTLAHNFEVNGIYYNYLNKTAKTVEVTYRGYSYDSYSNEYTGALAIPSSVTYNSTTYSITSIGNDAFRGCTGLTSVTIGNSVTSIGNYAFRDCSGLTSVTIPNSVTTIGSNAFWDCTGLTEVNITDLSAWCKIDFGYNANPLYYAKKLKLNGTEIKDLVIPNDITEIKNYAFYNCRGLTSVTLGNSVTSIGEDAFQNCSGLTSVTLGNSVTSIGSSAFSSCTGLTSITIPNSVTTIGNYAFYNCSGLTSITIPNSVTSIGGCAFLYCTGLTSVTIPNSVTSIGEYAFNYCDGLTSVNFNAENCTSMGSSSYPVFEGCPNLKTINIGNSVKTIPNYAFYGCTGLTSVTIGNSVTSIGEYAFNYCRNLKTIVSLNPTPPTCASSSSFDTDNYSSATLYVPKDSYAKYFIDEVWGKFSNIKKIEILATSITLDKSSITLDKWATETIKATIAPSNASVSVLAWTSDNPTVATVDQSGKITAISAGTAKITPMAIDGSNVSASCNVTVNAVETQIVLSQTEATLPVNDIMTLTYTVANSTNKTATWSTSNVNVAPIKVNSDGSVTVVGLSDGVATITATANDGSGASASCVVTVGVGGIEGVEVDDNAIEVARYDIHGRLLSEPARGINIIKMSDGTTSKEIVK